MEGNEVQHEEGRELSGGLVVKFKVSDRKAEGVKERQDSFEGGDVCRRSARLHGVIVDKATVESDENILVTQIRRDRKTTSEVGGGPFRVMGGVGVAWIRGGGRSKAGKKSTFLRFLRFPTFLQFSPFSDVFTAKNAYFWTLITFFWLGCFAP